LLASCWSSFSTSDSMSKIPPRYLIGVMRRSEELFINYNLHQSDNSIYSSFY
jgi:hypothetical protein